jgi:HEAT repeat protein
LSLLLVSLWAFDLAAGAAQQPASPGPVTREQLLARLNAADEESRLDALTRLAGLLALTPGAATSPTIEALTRVLQNDLSPVARALAARALEAAGDGRTVPALLAALGRERDTAARKAIIYALARYPGAEVTAALIPLLKDKHIEMRGTAAYALAELADPAASQALLDLLRTRRKDEDAFARSQAALALGRMNATAAIAALVTALKSDKADVVRREAARALGRLGSPQDALVIEALRAATLEADPYLSREAAAALAEIRKKG